MKPRCIVFCLCLLFFLGCDNSSDGDYPGREYDYTREYDYDDVEQEKRHRPAENPVETTRQKLGQESRWYRNDDASTRRW